MEVLKVFAVFAAVAAVNLLFIGAVVWLGATIVKLVFGS